MTLNDLVGMGPEWFLGGILGKFISISLLFYIKYKIWPNKKQEPSMNDTFLRKFAIIILILFLLIFLLGFGSAIYESYI